MTVTHGDPAEALEAARAAVTEATLAEAIGRAMALAREGGEIVRRARISFVSPLTDAASGLVEVIAEFDNADKVVRPGIAGQMPIHVGASGSHRHPAMRSASSRISPSQIWHTMCEFMPIVITVQHLAGCVLVVG